MLKEIKCNLFREPIVTFRHGLNVVLGDNKASNSIGKSTMLMIVDFVFGGESYVKRNYDVVAELGHHDFAFCFKFENELLYFIRSTARYKFVSCCNEKYELLTEIGITDYTDMLKKKYKLQLQFITFRDIISLYSRIWHKRNYDVEKPLHNANENAGIAVNRLIKLYNKFTGIKSLEEQIIELSERQEAIDKAAKKNYLTSLNTREYNESLKKADETQQEIDEITHDISGTKTT
jgi:hypothetical protein